MKDNTKYTIGLNSSLLEAMARLNALSGSTMTLFAIDDKGCLAGTLTDGDVRRAILAGATLQSPVHAAMHRDFKALRHDTAAAQAVALLRTYGTKGITLVPRLDAKGRIAEVIDLRTRRSVLPVSAILMAGGKGERLRPLTLDCPKPLLKIGGKAIIDYNVEALASYGITDITVCTGYLAHKIHDHFARPVAGVQVKCVTEDSPLGTIGAATLVKDAAPDGDTLIMNSDLLTTIALDEMYERHATEQADITVAVIPYQMTVPYALLQTDGLQVKGIAEKPSYSYLANAGIYMVRNTMLATLPPGRRTDATDFIEKAVTAGAKVVYYIINGTWIDVGSPDDFSRAADLMRHHRNLTAELNT